MVNEQPEILDLGIQNNSDKDIWVKGVALIKDINGQIIGVRGIADRVDKYSYKTSQLLGARYRIDTDTHKLNERIDYASIELKTRAVSDILY